MKEQKELVEMDSNKDYTLNQKKLYHYRDKEIDIDITLEMEKNPYFLIIFLLLALFSIIAFLIYENIL